MIQDLEFNCSGREKNKIMFRVIKSPFHKPLYLCLLENFSVLGCWFAFCDSGPRLAQEQAHSRAVSHPGASHRYSTGGAWHHNQPLCNWGKYLTFSVTCWMLTAHHHTSPPTPASRLPWIYQGSSFEPSHTRQTSGRRFTEREEPLKITIPHPDKL